MTKGIHIATAKGAVSIVNSLSYLDLIKTLNINDQEWKRLTGSKPWAAKERHTIERLIKHLVFGMCDIMGTPRFKLPCEFIAAVGISYISECNYFSFANWVGSYAKAEELGNYDGSREGPIDGLENVTPSQLFALMCELRSDEHIPLLIRRFNDKTEIALSQIKTDTEESNET